MTLKFCKTYYLLHDKFMIDFQSIEYIFNNMKIKNIENIYTDDNHWYINIGKKRVNIINILYPKNKITSVSYIKSNTDFRLSNLILNNSNNNIYELNIDNITILEKGEPYQIIGGKFSKEYRNMYWYVKDNNNDCYYIMNCIDSTNNINYFKFSKESLQKVLHIGNRRNVWYIGNNGYVATTYKENNIRKQKYLHQYIAEENIESKYNTEKNISIDHINRNKLDNRIENLRYASQTIQNLNQNKRKRQSTAKCDLPEFIKELPKYIEYRKETKREYFVINKQHPSIEKDIKSTTSNKVSLKDKYTQILKIYNNIDNYTMKKKYPKGIYFSKDKFVLDLKKDNNRYNIRMKALETKENYNKFINNIIKKYSNFDISYFKI